MPRLDGTGPMGAGPMTGRGFGSCGGGMGYSGCRRRRFDLLGGKDEREILKNEADLLKKELEAVNGRLSQLKDAK